MPTPLRSCLVLSSALALLAAGTAFAAPPAPPATAGPKTARPAAVPTPDPAPEEEAEAPATVQELTYKVQALETRLEQTQQLIVTRRPLVTLGGYVDFGFFTAQGDGSGIIRDNGNLIFPEYQGRYGWVFLGDLLAPTVNSRGEVADLGEPAGVVRFDGINSGGAPGFILNEINLTLNVNLGENIIGTSSVNFVPRSGGDFRLGDFLDVDLGFIEWLPTASHRTSIFVGKIDPVIGLEYRERKSSLRFGITPSLIGRYTMGPALGLKVRSKFGPSNNVIIAAALTNGSTTTEQFHFYDEIDQNVGKTISGRLGLRLPPSLYFNLEVGLSGAYGAQDRASNSSEPMRFWGLDLQARMGPVDVKAEFLRGDAAGWPADQVYGLDLSNGAYLEVNWMIGTMFGVLGRGEFRDAFVWLGDPSGELGANRAYITKSWRATFGARVVFSERVVLKAEYLRNGEYGGIPQIRNDVFTTSLVFMN